MAVSLFEIGCGSGGVDPLAAAQRDLEANNLGGAEENGRRVLADDPENRRAREIVAEVQRRRSRELIEAGEFEDAFRAQKKAATSEPARRTRSKDWIAAAEIAKLLALTEDALECGEYAVEADPTSLEARSLVASGLDEKGDLAAAVHHYLYIWEAARNNTPLGTRLATIYLTLKRYSDADTVYRAVLDQDPENVQAALGLAEALEAQDQLDEANRLLKGLTKRHPKNGVLFLRYSEFLERRNRHKDAKRYRKRAEKLLPGVKRRRMRKLR